jgi:phosphoserine aminotransferase
MMLPQRGLSTGTLCASGTTFKAMTSPTDIVIPPTLLPADGRFCCGPSRVRPEAVAALAAAAPTYLGTSHRQAPVKDMVGRLRSGVTELFSLPDGWEIVLGNGGTTTFWDVATFGLIRDRSQHLVFGEFSSKFAGAASAAPHLGAPEIIEAVPGTAPTAAASDVDLYALTHNETSTGVAPPLSRPFGTEANAIVAVDATSAAGGMRWEPSEVDCYYFAPQKCLASDGGLWIAACSPAAIDRIEEIAASGRWTPASLDLGIALANSRQNQTYNTPALATVFLAVEQIDWFNSNGGLEWAASRCDASSDILYRWAGGHDLVTAYVSDPDLRSSVVVTLDVADDVAADDILAACKANGIVDIGGYRKLGRNQLRIATFPAIESSDVEALTASLDHVLEALR